MGKKGKNVERYTWRVLHDPLPLGGFDAGTRFPAEDVCNMLRLCTFTLGTILHHHTYGKFKVIEATHYGGCYRMVNSRYLAVVNTGQKLKLMEFDKQTRNVVEVTA